MHQFESIIALFVIRIGSLRRTAPGHLWYIVSSGQRYFGYFLLSDGARILSGRTAGIFLFCRMYCAICFSPRSCGGYKAGFSVTLLSSECVCAFWGRNSSLLETVQRSLRSVWNRCHFAMFSCRLEWRTLKHSTMSLIWCFKQQRQALTIIGPDKLKLTFLFEGCQLRFLQTVLTSKAYVFLLVTKPLYSHHVH